MSDRFLPAIAFRLVAALAFAAMGACIKLAETRGATLFEMLFFRQFAAIPVVLAAVARGPGFGTLQTARIGVHGLRTAIGLASMACMFATVLLLPLAEATTMQFTVPIFATILGAIVLGEAVGVHRWSAVVIGFLGILIVAQPGSGRIPLLGAATGLTAALLSATVTILLRQIGQTERSTTTVFYFSVLSLIPLLPLFLLFVRPHPPDTWVFLILTGLVGGVGQIAMTKSLSLAPVSVVVPIDFSGLIWAILFGWLLFDALPTRWTWIGAPVVIGSGLYIVLRERRLQRVRHAEPVATETMAG